MPREVATQGAKKATSCGKSFVAAASLRQCELRQVQGSGVHSHSQPHGRLQSASTAPLALKVYTVAAQACKGVLHAPAAPWLLARAVWRSLPLPGFLPGLWGHAEAAPPGVADPQYPRPDPAKPGATAQRRPPIVFCPAPASSSRARAGREHMPSGGSVPFRCSGKISFEMPDTGFFMRQGARARAGPCMAR